MLKIVVIVKIIFKFENCADFWTCCSSFNHTIILIREKCADYGDIFLEEHVLFIFLASIHSIRKLQSWLVSSRLLKIIGLFCRITSLLQGSFAKETYDSIHSIRKLQSWLVSSRLPKIIGLFRRITSLLQGSFAKETYNFKGERERERERAY